MRFRAIVNIVLVCVFFLPSTIIPNSPYSGKKYSPNDKLSLEEQKLKSKDIYSNLQIDDQYLGAHINLDFTFTDTQRQSSDLRIFFENKPVVFSFVYFNCPRFCSLVLNAKKEVLSGVKSLQLGKDYKAITVSIDPRDTVENALDYEKRYSESLNGTNHGWDFLIGRSNDVKILANQIGFPYRFDKKIKEYEHPAGIFVLSPNGKICRYFYGVGYNSFDMKLAIAEAKLGKERTTVEKILLFCYGYNPSQKGYSLQAMRVMRLGGIVTMLLLFFLIARLYYNEKKKG